MPSHNTILLKGRTIFFSEFPFTDFSDSQKSRGGRNHVLFLSATSTCLRLFRYSFATLYVRWIPSNFNLIACNYQTTTRCDLRPYWITIWLIDNAMLISVCLFDELNLVWIESIWHGKPMDLKSHRLLPLNYKRTD